MKKFLLIAMSSFLVLTSQKVFAESSIEKTINQIDVKQLNSDEKFKLEPYKDKLILVDFWATWCGPCRESLPHLNELQNDFPKQLKVIAISKEDKNTVSNYLKDKNYKFSVVLDNNQITNNNFPHQYIPYSMLILPNGEVMKGVEQSQLTKKFISELIAKYNIKISNNKNTENTVLVTSKKIPSTSKVQTSTVNVLKRDNKIKLSQSESDYSQADIDISNGTFIGKAITNENILRLCEEILNISILDETNLNDYVFDLDIKWEKGNTNSFKKALKNAGFNLITEKRKIEVITIQMKK